MPAPYANSAACRSRHSGRSAISGTPWIAQWTPQSIVRAACQSVNPGRLVPGMARALHSGSLNMSSRSRSILNDPASCIWRTSRPVMPSSETCSYNLTWLAEVEALRTRDVVSGAAAGVIGGYVGTKVMNPVTTKLQEFAPEADRQREKAVSPGSPYKIGVQKAADLAGVKLDDKQVDAAASAVPYTVGIAGGLLYVALRRVARVNPVLAAVFSGMALFLFVDEGLTPTLGLSAPNNQYPLTTHLRGFLGHLAYGAGVAVTAELLLADRDQPRSQT